MSARMGAGPRVPLARDVRYALRQLRRAPGFTLALLLVLAGGVAVGATAVAVVQGGRTHPTPLQSPPGLPLPVATLPVQGATPAPPELTGPPTLGGGGRLRGEFPQSIAGLQREGLNTLLGTLGGVAGLAVALACCGVALLLLARATARRTELAMRAVLGAPPTRVVSQLLAEGLLLALLGGAAGALIGAAAVRLLRDAWPAGLAPWLRHPPAGALALGAALPLLAVLLCSLAPALAVLRGRLSGRIAGAGRATAGPGEGRLRGLLTIAAIGSSFALLTAAGLLLRGFGDGAAVEAPGFDARDTLTLQVSLPDPDPARRAAALERLLATLEATPGLRAGSLATQGTWLGLGNTDLVHALIGLPTRPGVLRPARYHAVSPGYFRALGVPVVSGREFSGADRAGAGAVAVVNEAFAHRLFPSVNPVGRHLQLGGLSLHGTFYTVVGVVRDPHPRGVGAAAEPAPALYLSLLQAPPSAVGLAVRASDPMGALPLVRRAVTTVAPGARSWGASTMEEQLAGFRAPLRWFGALLAALAAFTTLLAASSLYGVISFNVGRRTREIGVRMALGARAGAVARLIVGQGLRLALVGVVLGAAGALCLGRLLQFHFRGVRLADPVPYVAVLALVAVVSLVASYLPARRAARLDPVVALRSG